MHISGRRAGYALAVATCVLALPLTATAAPQEDLPAMGSVTTSVDAMNGSGCPAGTVTATMKNHNKIVDLNYRDLRAEFGPGVDPALASRHCTVTVSLKVPAGYTYALSGNSNGAFVRVGTGAMADRTLTARLTTGTAAPSSSHLKHFGGKGIQAGVGENLTVTDADYAPCNGVSSFTVDSRVRVFQGVSTERHEIYTEIAGSTRPAITTRLFLAWKKCPSPVRLSGLGQ